jgi:hypothetical protein|tara:strand:- start:1441 stop:1887 length:447 start_codon:yes stop_codon:yes gene_type:complete
MSITTECRECRQVFRKRSLKSTEKICEACRGSGGRNRYKVMANKTVNAIAIVDNMEKQIEDLKSSIDVLHSTIGVEVQHQITNDIKPIVEKIVDEKISELKGIIISSMTKSQKAQEEIKELTKTINLQKGSITRIRNKIKAFEKRLGI